MTNELVCNSCKLNIMNVAGSVTFKCPKCGQFEIVRCVHCRKIVAKFECPLCGFSGPN